MIIKTWYKGADQIGTYHKTEQHHRQFCEPVADT